MKIIKEQIYMLSEIELFTEECNDIGTIKTTLKEHLKATLSLVKVSAPKTGHYTFSYKILRSKHQS